MGLFKYYLYFILAVTFVSCGIKEDTEKAGTGLVGAWYHGNDLTRIGQPMALPDINPTWDVLTGRGSGWSAQWEGYVLAPFSGEVTFYATCDRELSISIENKQVLHVLENDAGITCYKMKMEKGKPYHIIVAYLQSYGGVTQFNLQWSWKGQEKTKVTTDYLFFTADQADWWHHIEQPNPSNFDWSTIQTIRAEHNYIFAQKGKFAGWPANQGMWSWDNELLVGFEVGVFDDDVSGGHSYKSDLPLHTVLARSVDNGKSWKLEGNIDFGDYSEDIALPVKAIDFSNPDLAIRIRHNYYHVSYNRGKDWKGPFKLNFTSPEVIGKKLTARTDYIPVSKNECFFFLSCETGQVNANYQDRAFCARTTDGGITFEFVGWITADTDKRSVMTSTEMIGENHLVSTMRRKFEEYDGERPSYVRNWIEAAESLDGGKTWVNLGEVARTDLGERNGNPPAMVYLKDGRLCTFYGYREFPYGIRMKVSEDNGRTWSKEYAVRTDGATWDIGYPRAVVNSDGKIVVTYYYITNEHYSQFIGASIINPKDLQ